MKQLFHRLTLAALLTLALFTSCTKGSDDLPGQGANMKLIGTWKFVGMTANTRSTAIAGSGADEEKVITWYGFNSNNNAGTITIDANNVTTNSLAYSIDTVIHTEYYLAGDLFDAFDTDINMSFPASSAVAPYKAVGQDSVYFHSGFITLDPAGGGSGTPTPTAAQGTRIGWAGDTLLLKTDITSNRIQTVNGNPVNVQDIISQIIKLRK